LTKKQGYNWIIRQNDKNNQHNWNKWNNRNGQNKQNGQRNQQIEDNESKDKEVPMRYEIQNSKETSSVKFKYDVDGTVEKTKVNIYKDGNNDECQKTMKEFRNYVMPYEIWENENVACTVYRSFWGAFLEQLQTYRIK
jgi:predicted 2-oxoglutarate/Fe(II)-dependent dioxygenase YbiX